MPISTNRRLLPILPSAALMLVGYAATLVNSQCTLCEDGTLIDPNGMIGSTSCADIDSVIGATPTNSATCVDAQLQGYLNCGCPTYPDAFCAMCSGGGTDITSPQQKIAFTDQTCEDVLFVKEVELDSSCADITQYESLCGCPDAPAAPATCSLCAVGEELTNKSTVVGAFATTCQDVFDYAPFVATAAECDSAIQPLADMCCLAPGETFPPTSSPSLTPTSTPASSTPTPTVMPTSDSMSDPTSAPSAATSTMTTTSWQWMATVALGAAVLALS